MKARTQLTAAPLLVVLSGLFWPAIAQAQAHVRVHVSNGYGDPASDVTITITGNGEHHLLRQDETVLLEYGRYTVEAQARAFSKATESILINQQQQVVPIALRLASVEGADPGSCAAIGRAPANAQTVRILQLFGTYSSEVSLTSGRFEFLGLPCGDYLLIAVGAKECLGTTLYHATAGSGAADIPPSDAAKGMCSSRP